MMTTMIVMTTTMLNIAQCELHSDSGSRLYCNPGDLTLHAQDRSLCEVLPQTVGCEQHGGRRTELYLRIQEILPPPVNSGDLRASPQFASRRHVHGGQGNTIVAFDPARAPHTARKSPGPLTVSVSVQRQPCYVMIGNYQPECFLKKERYLVACSSKQHTSKSDFNPPTPSLLSRYKLTNITCKFKSPSSGINGHDYG